MDLITKFQSTKFAKDIFSQTIALSNIKCTVMKTTSTIKENHDQICIIFTTTILRYI